MPQVHVALLPSLEILCPILSTGLAYWIVLLEEIEEAGGRLHLLPALASMLEEDYPLVYEYPNSTIPIEELINAESIAMPQRQAATVSLSEFYQRHSEALQLGLASYEPAIDRMFASDGRHKNEEDELACAALSYAIVQLYEYLSVAVHGERLSSLVAQAKAGDDLAFGKAVQIDNNVLRLPHFRNRMSRAHLAGEADFLAMIARKTANPPYRGRIEQKAIWLTLAFLDSFGWLQHMTGDEVLDFCQSVGVAQDVVDVTSFQKIIARFRDFQKRGDLSTP